MDFYFLPALTWGGIWGPGGSASRQRLKRRKSSLNLSNCMDEDLRAEGGYYPHALVSYYSFRRIALQFPKDAFILGDSGGFSAMRYGMGGLDPTQVLRWQNRLCTVGVLIDMPPCDIRGVPRGWAKALNTTTDSTRRALPLYETFRTKNQNSFRWWGVVHGWTDIQRDIWWNQISAVYPFTDQGEGWAIRARPTAHDPVDIARCIRWLGTKGITCAHFFAALGFQQAATVLVLGQEAGLHTATIDSAGMTSAYARNRGIMVPSVDGLKYTTLKESVDNPTNVDLDHRTYREARDYLFEQCQCFSCKSLRTDAKDPKHRLHLGADSKRWVTKAGSYWTFRFEFHNILILRDIIEKQQHEARTNPDAFLREILGSKLKYRRVLRAFHGQEPLRGETNESPTLLDYL